MLKCKHKFHLVHTYPIFDEVSWSIREYGHLFICEYCGLYKRVIGKEK